MSKLYNFIERNSMVLLSSTFGALLVSGVLHYVRPTYNSLQEENESLNYALDVCATEIDFVQNVSSVKDRLIEAYEIQNNNLKEANDLQNTLINAYEREHYIDSILQKNSIDSLYQTK